jgi:hypothetical protein
MAKQGAAVKEEVPMPRLADQYQKEIVPELIKQFGYKSVMEVPRIEKIVLNMGVGEAVNDKKILENAVGDLTLQGAQVDCGFQDSHRLPDRLQGYAAPHTDV